MHVTEFFVVAFFCGGPLVTLRFGEGDEENDVDAMLCKFVLYGLLAKRVKLESEWPTRRHHFRPALLRRATTYFGTTS
jgi:hypothetical protein